MRYQLVLQLTQALVTAAAMAKVARDAIAGGLDWTYLALLLVSAALLIWLVLGAHTRNRKTLAEGSEKYARYFAKWYDRDGLHQIFCDDLKWLEGVEMARVVHILCQRASQVKIYVREAHGIAYRNLVNGGVSVFRVDADTQTASAMSLHTFEGKHDLIIRHKDKGRRGEKISIETNPAQSAIALAIDFFRAMRAGTANSPQGGNLTATAEKE